MPNHITNRLIIEGATEEVAKVFDFLKADKPNESGVVVLVDFNKLVPMPESLEVESSSDGDLRYEVCWYDDIAAFMAEDVGSNKPFLMSDLDLTQVEIIGDIHTSPDLLK